MVTKRICNDYFCIILFISFCYDQNVLVQWQPRLSCYVKLMFVGGLVGSWFILMSFLWQNEQSFYWFSCNMMKFSLTTALFLWLGKRTNIDFNEYSYPLIITFNFIIIIIPIIIIILFYFILHYLFLNFCNIIVFHLLISI